MSGETVHYWILDDAIKARNSVEDRIKNELKTSVKKLRYRALEWDLDQNERKLLAEYERLNRMIEFARH
jgi:hypothetical protein